MPGILPPAFAPLVRCGSSDGEALSLSAKIDNSSLDLPNVPSTPIRCPGRAVEPRWPFRPPASDRASPESAREVRHLCHLLLRRS